jgi:hypothetical protein
MDWITTVAVFILVFVSYTIGRLSSDATPIKQENERLNAELKKLTDRDERGRFKGGK